MFGLWVFGLLFTVWLIDCCFGCLSRYGLTLLFDLADCVVVLGCRFLLCFRLLCFAGGWGRYVDW